MQKIRYDKILGNNIRDARKSKGFTQEKVISQMQLMGCEISRETYAKVESGIANVRAKDLVVLSQIFNVEISNFFQGI